MSQIRILKYLLIKARILNSTMRYGPADDSTASSNEN